MRKKERIFFGMALVALAGCTITGQGSVRYAKSNRRYFHHPLGNGASRIGALVAAGTGVVEDFSPSSST